MDENHCFKIIIITIVITIVVTVLLLATFEIDFSNKKRCPYTNTEYKYILTHDNEDGECSCESFKDEISRLNNEIRDLEEENEDYYCKLYPKKCKNNFKLTE